MSHNYEELYERCAENSASDEEIVGQGYDWIGDLELVILRKSGLRSTDTLVDFGCGTGRLAVKAVPTLVGGTYIGIEVSRNVLERAKRNVAVACPEPLCKVSWFHNPRRSIPLDDRSVDVICAFSVFTHLEHEDTFAYLADARRVIRPHGRFVFSCLPLEELDYARGVFREEAALDPGERWAKPRNVVTSRGLMDEITRLAGWKPRRWYRGDRARFGDAPERQKRLLGQSVCVLEPA